MAEHGQVSPIEVHSDGTIEVFEVYSPKLGRPIRDALTHSRLDNLLSDRGVVMIAAEDDFADESRLVEPWAILRRKTPKSE